MSNITVKHPTAVPGVTRRTPVAEVIQYCNHLGTTVSADTRYVSLAALLATLAKDNTALGTAQSAAMTRAKGAAAVRNLALAVVHTDIENICQGVQGLIDADPSQAAALATGATMNLRKDNRPPKPWLAGKMVAGTPGAAVLRAKAVKKGAGYEWQMSTDGKTWATFAFSTVANTTVTALSAGSTYYFRFRSTIGHVTSDWTPALTFMAH